MGRFIQSKPQSTFQKRGNLYFSGGWRNVASWKMYIGTCYCMCKGFQSFPSLDLSKRRQIKCIFETHLLNTKSWLKCSSPILSGFILSHLFACSYNNNIPMHTLRVRDLNCLERKSESEHILEVSNSLRHLRPAILQLDYSCKFKNSTLFSNS